MAIYIGLDVHRKTTTYVAQGSEGAVIGKDKVATSARRRPPGAHPLGDVAAPKDIVGHRDPE